MYILNISRAIKKLSVNEIKDSIVKNYYSLIGFSEEQLLFNEKLEKKKFIAARKQIKRKNTWSAQW